MPRAPENPICHLFKKQVANIATKKICSKINFWETETNFHLKVTSVCKTKHNSTWSKALFNAIDHMEFCLVLHLTNTRVDAKRAVKWQPILLPGMLGLLPTFTPSKNLRPANTRAPLSWAIYAHFGF